MNATNRTRRLGLVLALLAPLAAVAQGGPPPGAGGARHGGMYDPSTVTTIHGQIADVQRITRHGRSGVHLLVATGSETIPVRLGPDFYVDLPGLQLSKGDEVDVTGSRIAYDGHSVVIAQQVRKGDQVLALRDANGVPLWRGQRPAGQ